jgi:hypothetical protein
VEDEVVAVRRLVDRCLLSDSFLAPCHAEIHKERLELVSSKVLRVAFANKLERKND